MMSLKIAFNFRNGLHPHFIYHICKSKVNDSSIVVGHIFDGVSNVLDVLGCQTCYRDPAVLGHVDMMLRDHCFTLLHCQSREREHANLVRHVVPGAAGADSLERRPQELSHLSYAVSHSDQLIEPLLPKVRLVQNHGGYSCPVSWRRGIVHPDEDLYLREHFGSRRVVSADEMKCASSFAVKSHDLREGLSDHHFEALAHEVSESLTVFVEVSGDEPLVGCIEERIKAVLSADLCNLLPLLHRGIHSCRVVCACMKQDARARSRVLQIVNHTFEIKTFGFLVEVSVFAHIESNAGENLVVVTPSRIADVNWSWPVFLQKLSQNSQSSSATQRLGRCNSSASHIWMVPSEEHTSGTLGKGLVTINRTVLFVERMIISNGLFSLADHGEHERLSVVRPISTDTQVDLSGVFVVLVPD